MTNENGEDRTIDVARVRVSFVIPAARGTTEVKGSLEATRTVPSLHLELENRHGLEGEELDLINRLRNEISRQPIMLRLGGGDAE